MSLHAVFSPTSVAIIGASTQTGSVGNDIVKNLAASFTGKIYPVNPKGGELYNLPVFESVAKIKHSVDLAVICVPAAIVLEVLKQAGKKGIKAAIVISAGFKEVGNTELEAELVAVAKKYHFTLIGPNCLGVMNPHLALNASFAPTMPAPGNIAFLSQSGALGVAVLDYAKTINMGFSKFLSVGNKAAVGEAQLLEYLAHDPQTKVILLYAEELSDFAAILKVAHEIRRERHPKPIIILKSGQTERGGQAASSHTGALMGSEKLYEALFRQAGMIQANTVEELFLFAQCFDFNPIFKKDRVGVITNAGGLGVLVTDALVREGLTLATLSDKTNKQLQDFLPASASIKNPIDILGDAAHDRYASTIKLVAADDNVDALVILLTPQSMTEVEETARVIVTQKKESTKPIIVSFLGGERVQKGVEILHTGKIPDLNFPESTARGLGVLHRFSLWRTRAEKPVYYRDISYQRVEDILSEQRAKSGWLRADRVLSLLEAYGFPVAKSYLVREKSELSRAREHCGSKLVLKIISDNILHKSDVGGVVLNVTPETLMPEYDALMERIKTSMPDARIDGVLVMQQLDSTGLEVIIGGVRDPRLGALIACGMGGMFTETFKDASFGLAPLTKTDAQDMIERLQISSIIKGARGQQPLDRTFLTESVTRLSQLFTQHPEIAEVDINPVLLHARGKKGIILDARIRLF